MVMRKIILSAKKNRAYLYKQMQSVNNTSEF